MGVVKGLAALFGFAAGGRGAEEEGGDAVGVGFEGAELGLAAGMV